MPVSSVAEAHPAPSFCPKEACAASTSPISPDRSVSRIAAIAGKKRLHTPCRKKRSPATAASTTRCASVADGAMAFSQRTWRPADRHSRLSSTCRSDGVATYTTSRLASCASASYEPWRVATPYLSANRAAPSSDREPTAATSHSGSDCSTRTKSDAIVPVPMMPQRTARPAIGAKRFIVELSLHNSHRRCGRRSEARARCFRKGTRACSGADARGCVTAAEP
mmetsp:Transcript_5117/g.15597  ORF Transcript_5117/g.15597 Transcript_5117/m.15597 type:complete len:223 (+) Transcript_5117:561-1229(+)